MEKKIFKMCDYNKLVDFNDYEPLTAKQAVCAKCYECCAFQSSEVKRCTNTDCALWAFKQKWFKTPTKRTMSEEQRKLHSELFKNMHKTK